MNGLSPQSVVPRSALPPGSVTDEEQRTADTAFASSALQQHQDEEDVCFVRSFN